MDQDLKQDTPSPRPFRQGIKNSDLIVRYKRDADVPTRMQRDFDFIENTSKSIVEKFLAKDDTWREKTDVEKISRMDHFEWANVIEWMSYCEDMDEDLVVNYLTLAKAVDEIYKRLKNG